VAHLTIEEILKANDVEIRCVPCPEWGGDVYVRSISGDVRDAFELRYQGKEDSRVGMRAVFVALTMCDAEGRFLSPTEAEVKALGKKASGPLDRCFDAAMAVNKMRGGDHEDAKKNCVTTP
jgi:hypothetical protein